MTITSHTSHASNTAACLSFSGFCILGCGLIIFLPTWFLAYSPAIHAQKYQLTDCVVTEVTSRNQSCNNVEDILHEHQNGGVCIWSGSCTLSCLQVPIGYLGYCCSGGTCCTDSHSGRCGSSQPDGNYKLLITQWRTCYEIQYRVQSKLIPNRTFDYVKYCTFFDKPTCASEVYFNQTFPCWSPDDTMHGGLIFGGNPSSPDVSGPLAGCIIGLILVGIGVILCVVGCVVGCCSFNGYKSF